MVAHHTLGTHRCEPDTPLADNRSNDLRLVSMRGAAPPRHAEPQAVGAATLQRGLRVAGMCAVPAASDHRRQMFGRTSLPLAALTQRSSLLPGAARSAWRAWSCGTSPRVLTAVTQVASVIATAGG